MDNMILVCDECGGTHIQTKVWVDANTEERKGGDEADTSNNWCDDCEVHSGFYVVDKAKLYTYNKLFEAFINTIANAQPNTVIGNERLNDAKWILVHDMNVELNHAREIVEQLDYELQELDRFDARMEVLDDNDTRRKVYEVVDINSLDEKKCP